MSESKVINLSMDKLTQVYTILDKLGNFKSEVLPISFFYQTAKVLEKIKKDYSFFESKRKELIEEYAERDSQGNIIFVENENIRIIPERQVEFLNKFNELMEVQIELNGIKPIKILNNYNLPLTANELIIIMDFVEMEGED